MWMGEARLHTPTLYACMSSPTPAGCLLQRAEVYHAPVYSFVSFPLLDPTELWLVNGPNRCTGRLEVLHDQQWGSVCDNDWDMEDAKVVCRHLGCGAPISAPGWARFGRGYDPIWLETVSCQGTEAALTECRTQMWGTHSCHHGEDASVVCSGDPPTTFLPRVCRKSCATTEPYIPFLQRARE